ncbi:nitrogen regulation protein NR(II) [Caballeronia sp. BR00000012568055]|uniref:two-component system sensor histidine kinase NtrB n=1 Tax=Caballeronia sp. BR00000012568055 TaxID=2918761 RepID=UPI0023F92F58|nr:ATP-binding protein [Caballeronia sp. BR00000012568055]
MAIVHATAAFGAVLIGLTLAPFGRRKRAQAARGEGMLAEPSLPSVRSIVLDSWRHMRGRAPVSSINEVNEDRASLRETLERLPLAMLTIEANGIIGFANASAGRLFGYARHELLGASADMVVPGVRAASEKATLYACRKDRSRFLADVTLNTIDGPATLAVVIDRTERDELQRNRQELAHLTRVSMLGELAASLAHELNQPLTAILSNAQAAQRFMNRDPIDLDEVREILGDLVADNNRASEILRRIRALVKKGELERAPVSIASVIGDVALLVHSDAIVRGIRVVLDVDPQLPFVRGDKIQLQQVLLNLLLNAFDAMNDSTARVAVVSAMREEGTDMVRVSVRDEGHGLPPALADQLFRPFCTSKRDGLGLGLSISRTIVEMHGGRIWAQNNAERGATFSFTLPMETAS